MKVMAGVASVRSRIDRHCTSDYYSTTKKTATPLNEVCTRTRERDSACTRRRRENFVAKIIQRAHDIAARSRSDAKTIDKIWISCVRDDARDVRVAQKFLHHARRIFARDVIARTKTMLKNFSQATPFGCSRTAESIKNERISAK
jgi:hypothetical protein